MHVRVRVVVCVLKGGEELHFVQEMCCGGVLHQRLQLRVVAVVAVAMAGAVHGPAQG